MTQQPILNHIKKINSANDELFRIVNAYERKVDEMAEHIKQLESDIKKSSCNDNITLQDLESVINDVKDSLEYVLNQTPRNNEDITMIKKQIDEFNKRMSSFEKPEPVQMLDDIPIKTTKSIPKLNLTMKKLNSN